MLFTLLLYPNKPVLVFSDTLCLSHTQFPGEEPILEKKNEKYIIFIFKFYIYKLKMYCKLLYLFFSLRQRKGRLRRKMRRKNKISMTPLDQSYNEYSGPRGEEIELKSYKSSAPSPGLNRSSDKVCLSIAFFRL